MPSSVLKMGARPSWSYPALLTWLLAADPVLSHPKPTGTVSTASLETQYPPQIENARVILPADTGFYPTKLESDVRGFATDPVGKLGLNTWFDSFFDDDEDDFFHPTAQPTNTGPATKPKSAILESSPTKESSPPREFSSTKEPSVTRVEEATASLTSAGPTTTESIPTTTSEPRPKHEAQDGYSPGHSNTGSWRPTKPSGHHKGTGTPRHKMNGQDVFLPVATGPVPSNIKARDDHPVPKDGVGNTTDPVETNKFYSGLFLGTQTNATFTHPYGLAWAKGSGNAGSWGMYVLHSEPNVMAEGPRNSKIPGHPISYYVNPIGIQSMILSATELSNSTTLTAEDMLPFSANAVLRPRNGSHQSISFPVVQGMGYVTGVYTDLQPVVQTGVLFQKVVSAGSPKPGIFKYRAHLEDGSIWLIYASPNNGRDPGFRLESHTDLRGPQGWSGTIQVAKNPAGSGGEKLFDNSAGVFAVEGVVSGAVDQKNGVYSLGWAKAGKHVHSTPLMMFALPHHVSSFDRSTQGRMTDIHLRATTKGNTTAVIGEQWTMIEPDLPIDMGFAPWSTDGAKICPAAKKAIRDIAPKDLEEDIDGQTDLNSMYFSGKALSKFATLVYTVSELGEDPSLAASALEKLKNSFARFVENRQQFPLVYDNVWKGVVSSASYGGDVGADFGNTLYNDHHFHFGYFIHTAAIIGYLQPQWLRDNKDWVNTLVRDAGNPASDDALFPFSRAFDWFHGHSWAKGLFESFDGKDQESTSEDTMFAYALKMWGKTTGDASMEARGNLMLGVLRRSLHEYFLLERGNTNHPPNFVPNKVTGILFENKVDHTTYFGNNIEYIQGIHMLPLLPSSPFVRNRKFVAEEWNALFASNATKPANEVEGGWQGVLYANLALVDPATSWKFFARSGFDYGAIDGGATRTWYLAFAAGLGGCPS